MPVHCTESAATGVQLQGLPQAAQREMPACQAVATSLTQSTQYHASRCNHGGHPQLWSLHLVERHQLCSIRHCERLLLSLCSCMLTDVVLVYSHLSGGTAWQEPYVAMCLLHHAVTGPSTTMVQHLVACARVLHLFRFILMQMLHSEEALLLLCACLKSAVRTALWLALSVVLQALHCSTCHCRHQIGVVRHLETINHQCAQGSSICMMSRLHSMQHCM